MTKEFIPYEQALDLKELEFDEKCLGVYDNQTKELFLNDTKGFPIKEIPTILTLAPLYQQAFRWFKNTHNLYSTFNLIGMGYRTFEIKSMGFKKGNFVQCIYDSIQYDELFDSDEEAELSCLKKLIEIFNKFKI